MPDADTISVIFFFPWAIIDSSVSANGPATNQCYTAYPGMVFFQHNRPLAVIRALPACTFKTRALPDFALFNHLIRAGAAVAGYTGPEAADFPVKLVLGYIGID
jgi:hypothetical protein